MTVRITLSVNGKQEMATLDPALSLLDLLRDTLGEKSAKICCNTGECGACTVLLNGTPVNACVVLAADADGAEVTTAAGIAAAGRLHPVQSALIEAGASQCGYCTPGFVVMAAWLLDQISQPTMEEIREYLSGNICRCTGYTKIFEAIQRAAGG